jgi:hypothetical protein
MMNKPFILENGTQMDLNPRQVESLLGLGLIYPCGECAVGCHHIDPNKSWEDIDKAI